MYNFSWSSLEPQVWGSHLLIMTDIYIHEDFVYIHFTFPSPSENCSELSQSQRAARPMWDGEYSFKNSQGRDWDRDWNYICLKLKKYTETEIKKVWDRYRELNLKSVKNKVKPELLCTPMEPSSFIESDNSNTSAFIYHDF